MKRARIVLMVLVAAVLAAGTIVEKVSPGTRIYSMWWFVALMAAVAVATLAGIVQGRLWRRPALLLVHAAVVVILAGGGLSTWTGQHGSMTLTPQVPASEFVTEDSQRVPLPFSITLLAFETVPYSGTHSPMDFVSHIVCEGERCDISMNRIYRHRGYRFYQEDYDEKGNSTLAVAHDPWGIGVTYCGYALMLLGLLWMLASPQGRFRRLLGGTALLLLLPLSAQAAPATLPRATADKMGEMYVLYQGRICPMQTLAKDFTTKLTGSATYQGLSPEQVLAGYLFYFGQWADEPAIKHRSYRQLVYLDTMRMGPKSDKKSREANERYNLVKMLLGGKMLKFFPIEGGWYGQNDVLPATVADDEYLFVRRWQGYCQELVIKGDYEELERVFDKTLKYQQKQMGQHLPSPARTRAERTYNALTTGRWLALATVTLGLLAFACTLFGRKGERISKAVRLGTLIYVLLLAAFLLAIFTLRWVVGGHVPMAGGFDCMNLMSIIIGIVTVALARKHSIAPATGLLTMGFCQLVAMMSGSNPPVTHLMPVLNSPLLTVHVAVIMCSYALLFFVAMLGTAGLFKEGERCRRLITILLYPAVVLLAAGIMIGAVWANVSWGNYWSWDPKEVWALITLILYVLPLHPGVFRHPRGFCLYCLLAFFSVAVTYFGVNFFLGGMHAYNG